MLDELEAAAADMLAIARTLRRGRLDNWDEEQRQDLQSILRQTAHALLFLSNDLQEVLPIGGYGKAIIRIEEPTSR